MDKERRREERRGVETDKEEIYSFSELDSEK